MRYLILECHPGYAVLLDEQGRFCKAANLRYEVGQTVYHPILMQEEEKPRRAAQWAAGGLVSVAACLLLVFCLGYYQHFVQTHSSIYLAINPQVQMDLNRQGTVVRLTGANEDGEALLAGYDGRGKDKAVVADELIDRAIEAGFLSEGGQVAFYIDTPDDALFRAYGVELRASVTGHLEGRIHVTVAIYDYADRQPDDGAEAAPAAAPEAAPLLASSPPEASQPPAVPASSPRAAGSDDGDSGYDDADDDGDDDDDDGDTGADDGDDDDDD